MPIIVDRHTGKIISAPEITQEQRELVWKIIVRRWAEKNIDKLVALPVEKNNIQGL